MSDKVKLGIIGTGQIGKSHIAHYLGLSRGRWSLPPVPGAEIVAVCDINEAEVRRVAKEHGFPHALTDFRELLAMDEIVAVDVCLHNNLHAPVSIAAMEAGKHVYCEKPLAGSYVDAEAMVRKADQTGRMLSMQLGSLFSNETAAARRLIEDGHLGEPYYAKSSYYRRRGRPFVDGYGTSSFVKKDVAAGGALFDMGVYHISQILYLLDNPEVLTISGATHQEIDMYEERRRESGYDVEELAAGLVRLAGGITFFLEEAWAIHLGGTDGSKIVGPRGGVTLSPFAYHTTLSDMEMDANFDLGSAQTRWNSVFPETNANASAQHHWVAALQGQVELMPSARVGLNTMLISEGIYRSQELGREVTADEVRERSVSTALKV
ncbi:MAG: oxidoreductase [Planctomycetes bacterium SM23_32]|nr:MAG: oxidoreductase [Planctomycetes bacterium SM23_32]